MLSIEWTLIFIFIAIAFSCTVEERYLYARCYLIIFQEIVITGNLKFRVCYLLYLLSQIFKKLIKTCIWVKADTHTHVYLCVCIYTQVFWAKIEHNQLHQVLTFSNLLWWMSQKCDSFCYLFPNLSHFEIFCSRLMRSTWGTHVRH